MDKRTPELVVEHLCKYYPVGKKKTLKAVDDVSFQLYKGETLGIVGESGCGKTTCGKTCVGMLDKTSGNVIYQGQNIHELSKKEKFETAKKIQMIFQDPYASLDPHKKVYQIISEGIRIHHLAKDKNEEKTMVFDLLKQVGLNEEHAFRNVHEFSGGQRQRIGIARALAVNPEFLLCDEPVSALDVSIQAQIINLLMKLKKERNLTMIFIAHNLSVVQYVSDKIGVMYLGNMLEFATSKDLYHQPFHPYTKALLSAVPVIDPKRTEKRKRIVLEGDVPSPVDPPKGCRFSGRCKYCTEKCLMERPKLKEIEKGHWVACHLYE